MERAQDLLVAEIARRAGRASEEEVADALAVLASERRTSRTLSLAQVLIKRKKIYAEEFLEIARAAEAPLLRCGLCGHAHSAKEVDAISEGQSGGGEDAPECAGCGAALDVRALVRALPDGALALRGRAAREPGPITRLAASQSGRHAPASAPPPPPLTPPSPIATPPPLAPPPEPDTETAPDVEARIDTDTAEGVGAGSVEGFEGALDGGPISEHDRYDGGEGGEAGVEVGEEEEDEDEAAVAGDEPEVAEGAEEAAEGDAEIDGHGHGHEEDDDFIGTDSEVLPGMPEIPSVAASSALLAGGGKAVGRRFAGHEILSVLGEGGMGVVYEARQVDLDRIVALKVLREGGGARHEHVERFLREARAAAKLQHPNIVAIHEVGVFEGVHYLTMEIVRGETLHDRLRRGDRPPPEKAALLLATVARAVHYAHEHGIIHRDLKPGNILIGQDGVPKITDFGLAKTIGADELLTQSGAAIGTPLYMSPEQVKGDLKRIDARSDIFSLGTLLYQLLTGETPFTGDWHVELYNRILTSDPAPPRVKDARVTRDLETVCLTALEKRPEDRYPSARAFAEDLERAARGEAIEARPPSLLERAARTAKRHRVPLVAAAAALLVGGLALWWATATLERERRLAAEAARERARAEARAISDEAGRAAREGRWRDALERATVLSARFPESEEAQALRFVEAEAHLRLGRGRDAERTLARAYRRARDPEERGRALLALAAAFAAEDDHARALAACERAALRARGTAVAARAELLAGRLLAELDDPAGARRRLQAALAGDLAREERAEAQAALAWLDALERPLELPGAEAAAIGDVTGDGRPELLLCTGGEVVATELGPEGPVEVARGRAASRRDAVVDMVAADIDGGGKAEVVLTLRDADEGPTLLVLAAEPPDLRPVTVGRLEGRLRRGGLAAGDVDGDGRADLAIATAATGGGAGAAAAGGAAGGGAAGGGGGLRIFRSAPDGTLQAIPLAADPAARGTAVLSVLCTDLDRDGRAEVVVGTGGGTGDDVRIYRWSAGAGGLDVDWRQKIGPVAALAADDVDGDGARDLLVGRALPGTAPARRDERFVGEGVYLFRAVDGGRSFGISWRDPPLGPAGGEGGGGGAPAPGGGPAPGVAPEDALGPARTGPLAPLPGVHGARVRSLATGDVAATGAASVIALAEPLPRAGDPRERPARAVVVYAGFGRGRVEARRIVFAERGVEWARAADLDADGDAELVVVGRDGGKIYGVRGKR